MATTVFRYEEERRIAKSGGTAVLYIPNKAKEYFAPGDIVKVEVMIADGQIRIIAKKQIYNFDLNDIRNLTKQYGLTVEYDKELEDALVFNAIRDGLSVSYTQSRRETIAPGYVALSRKLLNLNPESYKRAYDLAKELKKKFDVVVRTDGDLDTINMLKEPERYKLKREEAIELIRRSGRKAGLSFVIRFDNRKNKLEEVENALNQLLK